MAAPGSELGWVVHFAPVVGFTPLSPTFYKKIWGLSMISKWKKTRRVFRFDLVINDTDFITEKPRRATGVEPAIPGIQTVCVCPPRHRGLAGDRRVNNNTSNQHSFDFFYRVEWGKTPTLNFNGSYLVDYCFLRQFEGMVGDGLFNSLSTYNISQICNVSRYTKFVQNLCKNLAPVLSLQKCSTGAKWVSYSM